MKSKICYCFDFVPDINYCDICGNCGGTIFTDYSYGILNAAYKYNNDGFLKFEDYYKYHLNNIYNNYKKQIPWVFRISIKFRPWFKKIWYTRGANFLEIQFIVFVITIGMPWKKTFISNCLEENGNLQVIKMANDGFFYRKKLMTFLIGKY